MTMWDPVRRRGWLRLAGAALLWRAVGGAVAADPPSPPAMPPERPRRPRRPAPYGLRVEPIDAAEARALGVAAGLRVVYTVGLAYDSGLRLADVIVEMDGRPVPVDEAFWNALDAADGGVSLVVLRDGRRVALRLAP
jgi:S1-C subfamily serine protease